MLGENLVQRVLFWLVAAVSTRLGMSAGARHDVPGTASRGPSLATTPSAEDRRVSAREREWMSGNLMVYAGAQLAGERLPDLVPTGDIVVCLPTHAREDFGELAVTYK